MKAQHFSAIIAITSMFGVIGFTAAGADAATTWKHTAGTNQSSYSWDDYYANVKPAGFKLPVGYKLISATMSVKNSAGRYVAKSATSKDLKTGRYTVYSTYRYAKKIPYTAYTDEPVQSWDLSRFTITSGQLCSVLSVDNYFSTDDGTVDYLAKCPGRGMSSQDFKIYPGNGMVSITESSNFSGTGTLHVGDPVYYETGNTVPNLDVFYLESARVRVPHNAYKLGTSKYAHVYRSVSINGVPNGPEVTRTEFNTVGEGNQLAWVRRVFGSKGHLAIDASWGRMYEWPNTSGGTVTIWFDTGASNLTWYS